MGMRKFLIVLSAVLLTGLVLAAWLMPANDDFRDETLAWNGISDMAGEYPLQTLTRLADLPPDPTGATLIAIPYAEYTTEELERLDVFAANGGRLILADDYGHGNQVLAYLGLAARFAGEKLIDPMVNYRSGQFPSITRLETNPLTDNVTTLVLNHATGIEGADGDQIIARSSSFSFLDLNGSGSYDAGEPQGPLAVIAQQSRGKGQVILIADPSIFINSMQKTGDNAALVQNIFSSGAGGSVYFDLSHLPASDLAKTKRTLAQARGLISNPAGTTLLAAASLALVLIPVWHKKKT
ncbi:MAG: DUF4350 domain-containing protein [Dehalococcoidales bacterium]|jgi:hypothetical protein